MLTSKLEHRRVFINLSATAPGCYSFRSDFSIGMTFVWCNGVMCEGKGYQWCATTARLMQSRVVGCGEASRARLGVRPWLGATPPSRAATLQICASPPRLSASRPAAAAPRSPLVLAAPSPCADRRPRFVPWAHTARTALC